MHKLNDNESLTIDYAKAIGIFFVVLGHYDSSVMNMFKPYTFHMPLFFFLGGITLNYNKRSISFIRVVLKSIIIYAIATYIITGAVAEFLFSRLSIHSLGNAFLSDPVTTISAAFKYNFSNNRLFVVAWFLLAYSIASTMCFFISKLVYNRGIEGATAILFCGGLLIGVFAIDVLSINKSSQISNLIVQSLVALMFFLIGVSLRQFIYVFSRPFIALVACIVIYMLRGYGITGDFIMSNSSYPYGSLITFTQAACGIYIVMFMSISMSKDIYTWLLFIGKRTKTIMSYHILSFITLDIVFYKAGMYDIRKADAFIHFKSWYSLPLYVSFAILLPACANYIHSKIRNFVKLQSTLSQKNT